LHAVYATDARATFEDLLGAGERSPRHALETTGARIVGADMFDPDGSAGTFWASVNTPEDLQRIAALRG
jgi:molybdopterin-guanine dinucleotide biosynthesis protein A